MEGATDNPGDAQRLREDHRVRTTPAACLSFIVRRGMKVAIFGNSGSGKSTLARRLASGSSTTVLDLDLVFWNSGIVERPNTERIGEVQRFCHDHKSWIIEGCHAGLIEASFAWTPELILMDPGS
jgi:adenylate kinase family enzyme